ATLSSFVSCSAVRCPPLRSTLLPYTTLFRSDVIMLGEIRDPDTAEMAFRAAQTGHLLVSTLHTNDALGAVTRLRDLGVDASLWTDRKSTRLNSSHLGISYAVFCLKKKNNTTH